MPRPGFIVAVDPETQRNLVAADFHRNSRREKFFKKNLSFMNRRIIVLRFLSGVRVCTLESSKILLKSRSNFIIEKSCFPNSENDCLKREFL